MRTWLLVLLSSIPATLLLGCQRCENDDPPPSDLNCLLLSQTGENLLGNSVTQYSPDSVIITFQGKLLPYSIPKESVERQEAVLSIQPGGSFSAKSTTARLLIRLSHAEIDTLDVTYEVDQGQCFDVLRYNSIFYNGQRMGQNGDGFYLLIKQ